MGKQRVWVCRRPDTGEVVTAGREAQRHTGLMGVDSVNIIQVHQKGSRAY